MELQIAGHLINKIKKHCEKIYPEECCGFMVGSFAENIKVVSEVIPVKNYEIVSERKNRFKINEFDFFKTEKIANKRNQTIVGIYHSHPDDYAKPSKIDLEFGLPGFSYFIISVKNGKINKFNSWILADNRLAFEKETLVKTNSKDLFWK